ncbi:MAG: HAMP domain-containing histidine kinase [Firmicutes bacterium]|nr:HAMP domain-containing histidine kinase [Bacillota bacterium]
MYKVSTQNMIMGQDRDFADLLQELAMGIAHDVRNPLSTVKGLLSLIQLQHKDDAELLEQTKQIGVQIDFASKTLSAFYNVFNPVSPRAMHMNPVSLCREVMCIFNGVAILNRVSLLEDFQYKGQALINAQGFTQIIINFVKNAMDAAGEGASITIGTVDEMDKVRVFVRDMGDGMEEEVLHNVFRAYYSTKERGTGLGLNISMHIARYFGWDIEAESEPGKGTTFSLIVPKF